MGNTQKSRLASNKVVVSSTKRANILDAEGARKTKRLQYGAFSVFRPEGSNLCSATPRLLLANANVRVKHATVLDADIVLV